MHVDTLRLIDRHLGVPLCWLLSVFRRIGRVLGRSRPLPLPRKILIIKLSEMGSTVLACPALAELRGRCPGAQLYFLVFKNNAAIIEALDLVPATNLVVIDYRSPLRLLGSGLDALSRLWRARIDTTIDMDFFSRLTAILSFIICRGNRVGFYRYHDEGLYRGNLLTHRVLYSPHVHTAVAFLALVRSLFGDPGDEPHYRAPVAPAALAAPCYNPAPEDLQSVRHKLSAAGVPERDASLILINPNSSDIFPLRKWPLDNFARLCERLLETLPHCWLVITGVAAERNDARVIMDRVRSPRCLDFTGKTKFRELLALHSLADILVTNDSGPAHFAALLRLRTIVLFGPETPRLYSPLGEHHKTLYSHLPCSPCVSVYNGKKSPCRDNRCLQVISVEQVLSEIHLRLPGANTREHSPSDGAKGEST